VVSRKELLEHLRAAHFAIVAAVLVLLAASTITPPAVLERASDEASVATQINAFLTVSSVAEAIAPFLTRLPGDALSVHEARNKFLWRVDDVYHPLGESFVPPPRPKLWIPIATQAFSPPWRFPAAITKPPTQRTVGEFKEAWSFLLSGREAYVVTAIRLSGAAFSWRETAVEGRGRITAYHNEEIVEMRDTLRPNPRREFLTDVEMEYEPNRTAGRVILLLNGGQADDPHVRYGRVASLPAEIRRCPIDLLPAFLNNYDKSTNSLVNSQNSPFDSAFRHLASYSVGLDSLTLEELRAYLERLMKQQREEVDLFGARIPLSTISAWGIIILVVMQLYFLANVSKLTTPCASPMDEREYPWIGVYTDSLSKTITLVSMGLVPVTAIVLVARGWESVNSAAGRAGLTALAMFSVSLAWQCVSQLITIANVGEGVGREKLEEVRLRAYQIWLESGRPEGEALQHWTRAWQECARPKKKRLWPFRQRGTAEGGPKPPSH
jgi:hypothetical protein